MRLLRKNKALRYFLPTVLLIFGLLVSGIVLAASDDNPLPASASSWPSNSKNVPARGNLKFGAYITTQNTPENIEQLVQHKVNLVGWFTHWDKPLANSKLTYACQNGYVPVITWESRPTGKILETQWSSRDIAAGKFDAKIQKDLTNLAETCKNQTVIIRFDHEMNLDAGNNLWYPWQTDPTTYISAWKHVVTLGHKDAPNVKWLWSVNPGDSNNARRYYPGDSYVDYVGITLNAPTYAPEKPQSFAKLYELSQSLVEPYGKPIMISETASAEGVSAERKADWVNGMFSYARSHHSIVGIVWFNEVRKNPNVSDQNGYMINSSPTTLKAFQDSVRKLYEGQN